ncbi:hypothetical protein N7467_003721 [Penicillium canescens]|nr:hypothetical protein N7467_003721 [Penicillium canescens]
MSMMYGPLACAWRIFAGSVIIHSLISLQTLRSDIFKNRTIITISQWINTIIDSDQIFVLNKGEWLSSITPAKLLSARDEFYELVKEAGLLEDGALLQ